MTAGPDSPSDRIASVIAAIPRGRVATYGGIARLAGNPRAARLVVWVLNSRSRSEALPWHRVLGKGGKGTGRISLPPGNGREEQIALLAAEGIDFSVDDEVDLSRFGWDPVP